MTKPDQVAAALTALIAAIRKQVRAEMSAQAPAPDPGQDRGPLLLTLPEAREVLRVSKATCDRLVSRKQLRAVKIGRRTFIPAEEIARFINEARGD